MRGSNGFIEHRLANGLRIVIEPMGNVQSAAAGFLVRTGARDEVPELAGVSHFLEHMCFKGTPKRDWRQITVDFDNLGSTYNAFTSKERTFYFGWVRAADLEPQMELIADMMQSVIPPEEFEMEKKVILEEIAMSEDQIDRRVYDLIHDALYQGHPLRWPVLGTTESIGKLTRDQLFGYFQDRYHPGNMVLLVAGAVDPKEVIAAAERICGAWAGRPPRPERSAPTNPIQGTAARKTDRFQQQIVALVFPAASARDEDRETADVMASILGGHNSRFFWNIMQTGIAPQVGAGRLDYCDAGLMLAFGIAEPRQTEAMVAAMRKEIDRLHADGVTNDEVQRIKNQSRTSLATEAESPYHRLMQLAQDVDVLGRPRDVDERLAAIDRVTPAAVAAYLEKWPLRDGFLASMGPMEWVG